ncbi:hypothetical protein T07_11304 [Trichinella nelsoni]|uniref:Uncharacterized protein n=1 Tax=Trichinella nelsoni TaxID=6336 RepID=A0A0V0RMJ3_9BILA|nr:hypothetical protein T07_11304 [Trichinella nelsoni]
MALRNSPAPEYHKQQLLRTAPLYAYRHRILQSVQLCVTALLHIYCILAAANEPAPSLPSRSTASGTSASGKNAVAISILIFSLFPLHEGTWFAIQDLLPSEELLGRNESSSLGRGPPETIPELQG